MCHACINNDWKGAIIIGQHESTSLIDFQQPVNSEKVAKNTLFHTMNTRVSRLSKMHYISSRSLYKCQSCNCQASLSAETTLHKAEPARPLRTKVVLG